MNLKAYIGIALLLVGVLLCYIGINTDKYSITLILLGAVPAGIGYFLIKDTIINYEADERLSYNKWRKDLKDKGLAIPVDFDHCELKNNQYREQVDKEYTASSDYMALDALVGRDDVAYNEVDQSVLVFSTEVNGEEKIFYSPTINKEKVSLQLRLATQKTTTIYVNPDDPDSYYFDLEFLER